MLFIVSRNFFGTVAVIVCDKGTAMVEPDGDGVIANRFAHSFVFVFSVATIPPFSL